MSLGEGPTATELGNLGTGMDQWRPRLPNNCPCCFAQEEQGRPKSHLSSTQTRSWQCFGPWAILAAWATPSTTRQVFARDARAVCELRDHVAMAYLQGFLESLNLRLTISSRRCYGAQGLASSVPSRVRSLTWAERAARFSTRWIPLRIPLILSSKNPRKRFADVPRRAHRLRDSADQHRSYEGYWPLQILARRLQQMHCGDVLAKCTVTAPRSGFQM